MRVMKTFQDVDFRVEVLLQLLVELVQVDGFDGYKAWFLLRKAAWSALRVKLMIASPKYIMSVVHGI